MADNAFRHNANTAVAQVKTFTIDTVNASDTWTFTLTDDVGGTHTVTYVEDGTPTVAEVVAGLVAAWNLSTNPFIAAITATDSSNTAVVLTADKAGVPFTVTLASSGSGTDTETATTANVGNSDYAQASNWELEAVPVATDDVQFHPGSVNVLYGLDQSSVALGDFRVLKTCRSNFGAIRSGLPMYLQIDPNLFRYEGNGSECLFDLGSAAIAPYIESHGSPVSSEVPVIYLKGSALTTLTVVKGRVGLAYFDGDTATIATVTVGSLANLLADAHVTLGSGLSLTTLDQTAGQCVLRCAATTVDVADGARLLTDGSGAITTMNARGTVDHRSTGTITTLNCWGFVDCTVGRPTQTITTLVEKPGGHIRVHAGTTISNRTKLADTGKFIIEYVD